MTKTNQNELAREVARKRASAAVLNKPFIQGTLVTSMRTCGTKSCRCHFDGPKHSATYLSVKEGKKRTNIFVPKQLLPYVKKCVNNYYSLQKTLDIISRDCIEIFQEKKKVQKKR